MSFALLVPAQKAAAHSAVTIGWSFRSCCDFQPSVTVNRWAVALRGYSPIRGTRKPTNAPPHSTPVPTAKRVFGSDCMTEIEKYKQPVDAAFFAMSQAKRYMKAMDPLCFKFPFGSAERVKAERDYDAAVKDYREKNDAFATARKLYDDVRMHAVTNK
jgi:hypothetical protein